MPTSLTPLQKKQLEDRRKKMEFDAILINNYKSNFTKEDAALLNDPNWDVEYYVDEFSGQPVRNVFLKQQKENIDTLRKPQSQGYRYEMLTQPEKEMAEIVYRPLPEKLRRKLGVTIKAGKRVRLYKRTAHKKGKKYGGIKHSIKHGIKYTKKHGGIKNGIKYTKKHGGIRHGIRHGKKY